MSSRTRTSPSPTSSASSARRSPQIVDGLTKIGNLPLNSTQERQVENYRKLLLSIAKDARVILIKLADRLHNMRTLDWLRAGEAPPHRAGDARPVRAARAPLRYGEDAVGARGPRVQAPRAGGVQARWRSSSRRSAASARTLIAQMRDPLERALKSAGIKDVDVTGRPKHLWSIYKKMKKRDKPYEEIYDLLAIRVLVNSVPDCYHALGVIHDGWTPLQERIKDYIAQPKSNGYQSLHTTVFGPGTPAVRDSDPHARDAPHGGIRHRGALALQGGREERRRARPRSSRGSVRCSSCSSTRRRPTSSSSSSSSTCIRTRSSSSRRRATSSSCRRARRRSTSRSPCTPRSGCTVAGAKVNGRIAPLVARAQELRDGRDHHVADGASRVATGSRTCAPAARGTRSGSGCGTRSRRRPTKLGQRDPRARGQAPSAAEARRRASWRRPRKALNLNDANHLIASIGQGDVNIVQVLQALYPDVETTPSASRSRTRSSGSSTRARHAEGRAHPGRRRPDGALRPVLPAGAGRSGRRIRHARPRRQHPSRATVRTC